MSCRIYILTDPSSYEIRYVGKTTKSLSHRLSCHISPAELKIKTHKTNWIKSLLKIGMKPQIECIEIIETTDQETHSAREIYWIAELRKLGVKLTNTTDGGEGVCGISHSAWNKGLKASAETRRKQSQAKKGKATWNKGKSCPSLKGKPSWLKGQTVSEETRVKISSTLKGRIFSDETRAKISAAKKGKPNKLKGTKLPESVKQKISSANKGRSPSNKGKKKIIDSDGRFHYDF